MVKSGTKQQSHRTLVLWALFFAAEIVDELTAHYHNEKRPAVALQKAKAWASGDIKMREAQRAILDVHAFAKDIDNLEHIALCHAVGQACGVVHAPGHALGLPMYELTAIIRREGLNNCQIAVETRLQQYEESLEHWSKNQAGGILKWANFIAN